MPDQSWGTPRNWTRLCLTVNEFKNLYGTFPTAANLGVRAVFEIRRPLTMSEWRKLNRRLPIRVNPLDDWEVEVSNDSGGELNYAEVRVSAEGHREAEIWLGDLFAGCYSIP
jgi:hypothetical protein